MKTIKIDITSVSEALDVVSKLDEFPTDEFMFTNKEGNKESDARAYIGIIYALSEFGEIYLVNKTHDGLFPESIK